MKLVKSIEHLAHRHGAWQVWQDFLLMAATALANAVDLRPQTRDGREQEYLRTASRYTADEMKLMCALMAQLAEELEIEARDVLGQAYMALELGNKWTGQFFTPDCISRVMADLIVDDSMRQTIEREGFITVQEPALGGGAMIIGLYNAMRSAGLNPQTQMHVTGIDVDIKSIHMAYIQLALLNVPATLVHGNTLTLETRSVWHTPAHILNGWRFRLDARHRREGTPLDVEVAEPSPIERTPVAMPVQRSLFEVAA